MDRLELWKAQREWGNNHWEQRLGLLDYFSNSFDADFDQNRNDGYIDINASGQTTISTRDGRTISLSGSQALNINKNSSEFHRYQASSVVGYTSEATAADKSHYSAYGLVETTIEQARVAALYAPAPNINPFSMAPRSSAVHNGAVSLVGLMATEEIGTEFVSPGPVAHAVGPNNEYTANITVDNHLLHVGQVIRVATVQSGLIYMDTFGIGEGRFGYLNSLAAQPVWTSFPDGAVRNILREGIPEANLDFDGNLSIEDVYKQAVDPSSDLTQKANALLGPECFVAGTQIEMPNGSFKNIENIKIGDEVLAFDEHQSKGQGAKQTRRVTDNFINEDKQIIDFMGLNVTPGHAFLSGDGTFKQLIDILREDGTVVLEDGQAVRARTGMPVDSKDDQIIPVGYLDAGDVALTQMRAGVVYGTRNGEAYTLDGMMHERGYHLRTDGKFINAEGNVKTAYWEWGKPDDQLIAGRYAPFDGLVEPADN